MILGFVLQIFILVIVSWQFTSAWMPLATSSRTTRRLPTKNRSFTFYSKNLNLEKKEAEATPTPIVSEEDSDNDTENNVNINTSNVEWGVSYIGGDPCGSKYNSDPFDKSPSDKPGMPDDMKARIEALAQKKLREQGE
mmetsp:Transcript_17182/g.37587  ORF Transcript_17182/g.37587 Transcript_17182/m.37587 type:complete len:138 (-) Transcript_17182:1073-1486(-)|eukprot:CAMPEP_0168236782 /NCGR_PEP_ID=MMETSP0140_2-20121125/19795_1 /TAXON_ID=44445 /ORGANISM="Pseudo-nitzschia australis, Strain 10249 10 AB" /LENGTH=137 /DNA_ID=CAMNT_0008170289 /DNA_START=279 /DNA_END=692 /DNA_ORIENTATION=-